MNARKSGRLNPARVTRTFKLSPTTRAIRTALATMLALSGGGVAFAGDCESNAANTMSCNGAFTETVPGTIFAPTVDLTLILGDDAPTSVIPLAGDVGIEASWGGMVGITSFADISTVGADAIHAYGSTSATLGNYGSISTSVTGAGENALDISAYGDVTVVNNGPILATGSGAYDVTAVTAYSVAGNISFDNQASGSITATSDYSQAIGVAANALAGSVTVRNAGVVAAAGDDLAIGIESHAGIIRGYNTGSISVSANELAIGMALSSDGFNILFNDGSITVSSTDGDALGASLAAVAGVYAYNLTGTISVTGYDSATGIEMAANKSFFTNGGSITVSTTHGDATGIVAHDVVGGRITNSGTIQATSATGSALGVSTAGATAYFAAIDNSGTISATGADSATGVLASAEYYAPVTNTGTITASAGYGNAIGIFAEVIGAPVVFYDTYVNNAGNIVASSEYGNATGIWAESDRPDTLVDNSGVITVDAYGLAAGIRVQTQTIADANVSNSGSVTVTGFDAVGISTHALYGDAYVGNTGNISVSAGIAPATGIVAASDFGAATVVNAGDIHAQSTAMARVPGNYGYTTIDYAIGIIASSGTQPVDGNTSVTNSGNISTDAGWWAQGIQASARYGVMSVANTETGTITSTGDVVAIGIGAAYDAGYFRAGYFYDFYTSDAVIDNSGSITVVATGECGSGCPNVGSHAVGINAFLNFGDDITVTNSGDISVSAHGNGVVGRDYLTATGIMAITYTGDVTVDNSGSLVMYADGTGSNRGIHASSIYGAVSIANSGSLSMYGANGIQRDYGIFALSELATGDVISVLNSGEISIGGDALYSAFAILAVSTSYTGDGVVTVTNTGDITLDARSAAGIAAQANSYSNTSILVDNSGSIALTTVYGGSGLSARSGGAGAIGISNSGDISIASQEGLSAGVSAQYGIPRTAANIMAVDNSGTISISVAHTADAPHVLPVAVAYGVWIQSTYGEGVVVNSGVISTNVRSDYALGFDGVARSSGIVVVSEPYGTIGGIVGDATVINSTTGSILATAESNFGTDSASANGIYVEQLLFRDASSFPSVPGGNGFGGYDVVSAGHGLTVDNLGYLSAVAIVGAAGTGTATATGIRAVNGLDEAFVHVSNAGTILATATSPSTATATGVFAAGHEVTVALGAGGHVNATATGADGNAIGLSVSGDLVTASNAGAISAEFIGGGDTYGALIASTTGEVTFTNSGSITATDADYAVGVQLDSVYGTTLINSGTITAVSSLAGSIAVRTGVAADQITNTGTINGALITGDGDDTLDNGVGGLWNAFGSSDFGGGDDTINNAGTIHLDNAFIGLGSSTAVGNAFTNTGTITVSGDSNTIDMGSGAVVSQPFLNNGVIDFQDGAPDDVLTITGDFGGQGDINVDVSGLHLASDQLYIDGSVLSDSVNTINVDLLELPSTITDEIQIVSVSGDSIASNFVLGDVHFNQEQSFVTMDFDFNLVSDIDTSNASADIFALGMSVTGLSDTGTLGAAIAPGAQSLMTSQIGTWRQRMGVIDKVAKGGLSLWARYFTEKGTVTPEHTANNFGQGGNFDFDQKNSGTEIGADFAISDQFSAGLLLAKVEGDQTLGGSGIGRSTIKGDSYGVYGTWLPGNGFYLDASYRAMSFDVTLHSRGGEVRGSGNANAFNVEAGYAWSLAGMLVEPQFQYTRTTVDDVDALDGVLADFQSEGGDSSRARLGVMVRKTFGEGGTTWTPYAGLSAVREFDGSNAFAINDDFTGTTSVEGTSALVEGGVTVQSGNLSVFGGLNWQDGGALDSFVGGQVGVRYTW